MLNAALDDRHVGIVGATGSWVSNRSLALQALGLPNAYKGVMPGRQVVGRQFASIDAERARASTTEQTPASSKPPTVGRRVRAFADNLPTLAQQLAAFPSFPAAHMRTNAFMLDRNILLAIKTGTIATKQDTYRLEAGSHSITRQLQARNLNALVIDRHGEAYPPESWALSQTLWQSEQQNLLVSDNQTRLYSDGDLERRIVLSTLAWGSQATPAKG